MNFMNAEFLQRLGLETCNHSQANALIDLDHVHWNSSLPLEVSTALLQMQPLATLHRARTAVRRWPQGSGGGRASR